MSIRSPWKTSSPNEQNVRKEHIEVLIVKVESYTFLSTLLKSTFLLFFHLHTLVKTLFLEGYSIQRRNPHQTLRQEPQEFPRKSRF